jgi:hypothetical protein
MSEIFTQNHALHLLSSELILELGLETIQWGDSSPLLLPCIRFRDLAVHTIIVATVRAYAPDRHPVSFPFSLPPHPAGEFITCSLHVRRVAWQL